MKKHTLFYILLLSLCSCATLEFGIVGEGNFVLSSDQGNLTGEVSASITPIGGGTEWLALGLSSEDPLTLFNFVLFANSDGKEFEAGKTYYVSENDGTAAAVFVQLFVEYVSVSGSVTILEIDRVNKRISLELDMEFEDEDDNAISLQGKGVRVPYED